MNAALSSPQELNLLPRVVAETMLLRHFAGEAGAFLAEKESHLENEKYFLAQAQIKDLAGFGRGPTKRSAHIKAIAEYYERRFMHEAFSNELSSVPKVLQTSNGFAVHFSEEQAHQAATCEAIERHLLQYSFLKDGWGGFKLTNQRVIGDELLTAVTTKYSINGFRAGMVLATSPRFPGISFGYFADQSHIIESSRRWSHAAFEALDKIEPFISLGESKNSMNLTPIDQGILKWMMEPQENITFPKTGFVQSLPTSSVEVKTFDLSQRWNLDFPLFGAYGHSAGLLPLIVVDRLREDDSKLILDILGRFDLPNRVPERNPVL